MLIVIGLLAAAAGFGISLYIYRKQHAKQPLMCPRRAPCETVIASPQAKTVGISNAVLGMVYYAAVFLLLLNGMIRGVSLNMQALLILLTAIGFLFSLYLIGVQHFVIKQWCAWCLGSALAATVLFLSMILLYH